MAKKKTVKTPKASPPKETKKPKRRTSLVKRAKRHRAHREAVYASNPPPLTDLVEFILPGFAGYGATRLVSRLAYVQLSKKWPRASEHLAVGTSVLTALAAWFLAHRVKRLEKYHTPLVVGSSIAALQSIVQCYLPKFGWMVSDYADGPMAATKPKLAASAPRQVAPPVDDFSDIFGPDSDEHLGILSVPTVSSTADDDLDETLPDDYDD